MEKILYLFFVTIIVTVFVRLTNGVFLNLLSVFAFGNSAEIGMALIGVFVATYIIIALLHSTQPMKKSLHLIMAFFDHTRMLLIYLCLSVVMWQMGFWWYVHILTLGLLFEFHTAVYPQLVRVRYE